VNPPEGDLTEMVVDNEAHLLPSYLIFFKGDSSDAQPEELEVVLERKVEESQIPKPDFSRRDNLKNQKITATLPDVDLRTFESLQQNAECAKQLFSDSVNLLNERNIASFSDLLSENATFDSAQGRDLIVSSLSQRLSSPKLELPIEILTTDFGLSDKLWAVTKIAGQEYIWMLEFEQDFRQIRIIKTSGCNGPLLSIPGSID